MQLRSDGKIVRRSLHKAGLGSLTAWRPPGSQTNHVMTKALCSRDSSEQDGSCITVSDLAPDATSLSPVGHRWGTSPPGLRTGHWIPCLDNGMTSSWKNTWYRSYWYGHLWKKHSATVCPLAAIIHISPTYKICFCPSNTIWKFPSDYGFRLRLKVECPAI